MSQHESARITAVLGPTNTGKTHLAIERMLGHKTGMIGFPLRLLARENYDRVVARTSRNEVALITGEEKIIPARARYFLCTVESMPMDMQVDFLAIDEVQLAGDPERGHVFTDRILRARGIEETMLLGAETIRPLLRKLIPQISLTTRPRLSRLSYVGPGNVTRLPRRSAVVVFTAQDVYALAEMIRRQRGGAAVVLGALSPRTRNAQVAMYQAGEVDYLIATDAIGMGLNMDIDHVAFAANTKFDGTRPRRLGPPEVAQIAGRAGRHMNDGTFGVTAGCPAFDAEMVNAVEAHEFEPLKILHWRNDDLSFESVRDLLRTLEARPPWPFFYRKRDADDHRALETLARDADVARHASSPARVRLLWEVCQIPDFRRTLSESHALLLTRIYRRLTGPGERLPGDWVDAQMTWFDRTDGDIDTLSGRINHVRTWTYITHRADWFDDPAHWRERARAIEDRLSDALHERLTQRFVDRRAAVLVRKLKDSENLIAAVAGNGDVSVEGQHVGRLDGLLFNPVSLSGPEAKPILTAARRVLPAEFARRAARIQGLGNDRFSFGLRGEIVLDGAVLARLEAGREPLSPAITLKVSGLVDAAGRRAVHDRLTLWLDGVLVERIGDLMRLRQNVAKGPGIKGPARGILFQLAEWLGCLPRAEVDGLLATLDEDGRKALAAAGVRFGTETVFMPTLLKPKAAEILALLWSTHNGHFPEDALPTPGRVTVAGSPEVPDGLYYATGYVRLGSRVIRADMVERLAATIRKEARRQPFGITPLMMSLAGVGVADMRAILTVLGYRSAGERDGKPVFVRRSGRMVSRKGKAGPKERGGNNAETRRVKAQNADKNASQNATKDTGSGRVADSPFAVLADLQAEMRGAD